MYLQYYFWLVLLSVLCLALERVSPWHTRQKALRTGIWQDLFWLVFNGHFLGLALAMVTGRLVIELNEHLHGWGVPVPESIGLLMDQPLWAQLVIFFVVKDFIEWNIHRLLHAVPWLWEFHKLHHSIKELDWIGNFRFHWAEVIVYKTLTYLPLVILGVDGRVLLIIAVIGTLMQHLNHANLAISWGPFRYLLNSPKMHIWHHDVMLHGKHGQNYAIVLSVWDWLFGTVYWPRDGSEPAELGFDGIERFPRGVLRRLIYPLGKS